MKSLEKVMAVLDCFSEGRPEWGVTDLARELGLPKSTIHEILRTLEKGLYVQRNPDSYHYRLGLKVLQLGFIGRIGLRLREYALPHLEELQEQTGQIVYLTIPFKGQVLYLEAVFPSKRLVHYSVVGRTQFMHCTGVGKALLAYLPEAAVQTVLEAHGLPRFTPATICTPEELQAELAHTRERGYAVDNGESDPNIRCVAVPIRTRQVVAASMSVSGHVMHFTDAAIRRYAELLLNASGEITHKLNMLPAHLLYAEVVDSTEMAALPSITNGVQS